MRQFSFLILIIYIFSFQEKSHSQNSDPNLEKGINYIYDIKFDSATMIFDEIILKNPENPQGYFFKMIIEWWKINLDKENESNDANFIKSVDKVIEVTDKILDKNDNDFTALFYKGGAIGYRGLVRSMRDSWLKAAEDGREALNLFGTASELNPNDKDISFGIGLYNYFAEYVPDKYPFVKPLMILFPSGNKSKGLFQIQDAADNSRFAKNEARSILVYLYLNYEKNFEEAEKHSRILLNKFPNNSLFERYLARSYTRRGLWDSVYKTWNGIILKSDSNLAGYNIINLKREGNYYIALSLSELGRIAEAYPYIQKLNEISDANGIKPDAYTAYNYLLLGMYYDKLGERDNAINAYKKVLSLENFDNSHTSANRFLQTPYK
ncbi:MAG TPA: tetratricopeptide repeat protein [Ignavibacteria bacterium]|nr:tetratricopeptide repeat protein [Ignavibacteria bacterium]